MPVGISTDSQRRRNFPRKTVCRVDKNFAGIQTLVMRLPVMCLIATALLSLPLRAQVPVFKVTPIQSSIRFDVRSSKPLTGNFAKWSATLTFASTDPTSGALDVEIQAASLTTGSSTNDEKLKGKDFLDASDHPVISFKTNRVVQTSKTTYDLIGNFTMRGMSRPATLNLMIDDQSGGSGYAQGVLSFDRKDFGMAISGSDHSVEVDLNLKVEQVSGPPLVRKKYRG
jgi:polyisoprenoid-binding protein YceI